MDAKSSGSAALAPDAFYIGVAYGKGVKEISYGRLTCKIVWCSWVNDSVICIAVIEITPSMSV